MQVFNPSHPGEIIREDVIGDLGLSVTDAARLLGVGRPALSAVLNERANLSPEMALRLEKAFDVSMDLLLKMQLQFDIAQVRKTAKAMKVRRYEPAA
jgi:addiction module HigA family antidote